MLKDVVEILLFNFIFLCDNWPISWEKWK
jgi:hypothetical protein